MSGTFTFFFSLIQVEKTIFNLTLSETDLNRAQRTHSVPIESYTMLHFVRSCVRLCTDEILLKIVNLEQIFGGIKRAPRRTRKLLKNADIIDNSYKFVIININIWFIHY